MRKRVEAIQLHMLQSGCDSLIYSRTEAQVCWYVNYWYILTLGPFYTCPLVHLGCRRETGKGTYNGGGPEEHILVHVMRGQCFSFSMKILNPKPTSQALVSPGYSRPCFTRSSVDVVSPQSGQV